MVRRIITALTKPIRGLHEAAYLLAVFTVLSQVLALVRDRTFAHVFGAGSILDSYFAAFRVPDLVFAFLTLFVSSFALIPLLSARGEKEQGVLVGNVLMAFGAVAIAVSALLWVSMPSLIPLLFPGFSGDTLANTILLSQIMLLQPIILGFSSIASSVIQVLRRFVIYALAPVLYNVGIIIGAVFLYPSLGIAGLAWGVVLGALLHLATQAAFLIKTTRHMVLPTLASLKSSIVEVALPSVPRSLALWAHQIVLLVFVSIASLTAPGAVAALSFALNLQSVPLSIVGVSYAAALFPALAALYLSGQFKDFTREVWASVRHIIFWTLPAIAFIIVLRAQIVRVILGSGEFSWSDTRLTAAVLALFAVSLVSQAIILIFSRAYYAAKETLTPIIINVSGALFAGVAAYLGVLWLQTADFPRYMLESLFRVSETPGTALLMIPLSYSVMITVSSLIFAVLFARRFGFDRSVLRTLGQSFAAATIGAAAAYLGLQTLAPLLPTDTFLGIFAQGLGAAIVGGAAWLGMLVLLKNVEFSEIISLASRRLPPPNA